MIAFCYMDRSKTPFKLSISPNKVISLLMTDWLCENNLFLHLPKGKVSLLPFFLGFWSNPQDQSRLGMNRGALGRILGCYCGLTPVGNKVPLSEPPHPTEEWGGKPKVKLAAWDKNSSKIETTFNYYCYNSNNNFKKCTAQLLTIPWWMPDPIPEPWFR